VDWEGVKRGDLNLGRDVEEVEENTFVEEGC
jgi:hypothetical protein